jgi:hypothetical protein
LYRGCERRRLRLKTIHQWCLIAVRGSRRRVFTRGRAIAGATARDCCFRPTLFCVKNKKHSTDHNVCSPTCKDEIKRSKRKTITFTVSKDFFLKKKGRQKNTRKVKRTAAGIRVVTDQTTEPQFFKDTYCMRFLQPGRRAGECHRRCSSRLRSSCAPCMFTKSGEQNCEQPTAAE